MRRVLAIGFAGAVAGLIVGGVGDRLAMRVSAIAADRSTQGALTEAGNRVGEITVMGTVGFVIFGGLMAGVIGSVVVVIVDRLLPRLRWAAGPVMGVVLLGGVGGTLITPHNPDFHILDPAWLNVVMFGALPVLFGVIIMPLANRFESSLNARYGDEEAWRRFVPLLLIGGLFAIPAIGAFFFRSACDCPDPPVTIGLFVLGPLGVALATTIWAVSRGEQAPPAIRIAGWLAIAGAMFLGYQRLIDHVARIV